MLMAATLVRPTARRSMRALVLAAMTLATIPAVSARAEYPHHPVAIVSCFPPGGGTVVAVRMINSQLGEALRKPVIVENCGGV